jgi:hypothetical protein
MDQRYGLVEEDVGVGEEHAATGVHDYRAWSAGSVL